MAMCKKTRRLTIPRKIISSTDCSISQSLDEFHFTWQVRLTRARAVQGTAYCFPQVSCPTLFPGLHSNQASYRNLSSLLYSLSKILSKRELWCYAFEKWLNLDSSVHVSDTRRTIYVRNNGFLSMQFLFSSENVQFRYVKYGNLFSSINYHWDTVLSMA